MVEFLSLHPMFPHKPFDCSGGLAAFRYLRIPKRVVLCVFFPFILDIKFVGRTSRGVTQEEGHTGFLIHLLSAVRALIFLAGRIQPFLSLVDREVEFCVKIYNRSPPVGHF